jgi:hypothetical protein
MRRSNASNVVQQRGRVGERLTGFAEDHGEQPLVATLSTGHHAEPGRARETGLHPDRPRVQPEQHVAVLDDARLGVERLDRVEPGRDDAREAPAPEGRAGEPDEVARGQ